MANRQALHLGWLLAAAVLVLTAGCGSGGISCEEFEATPDPGGELCEGSSDCTPVDCPCADGTVIETRSCYNGRCEGKAACADACRGAGGQLDCSEPCQPATCDSLGAECGTPVDGCGETLSCGGCSGAASCQSGQCVEEEECVADTCESLGAECGEPSDGCGGTLSCGDCGDSGLVCSSATCVSPQVTGAFCPSTCDRGFYPAVVECNGCAEEYCYYNTDQDGYCTRECFSDVDCTDIGSNWRCGSLGYCVNE